MADQWFLHMFMKDMLPSQSENMGASHNVRLCLSLVRLCVTLFAFV
jgi:hypothetical protein